MHILPRVSSRAAHSARVVACPGPAESTGIDTCRRRAARHCGELDEVWLHKELWRLHVNAPLLSRMAGRFGAQSGKATGSLQRAFAQGMIRHGSAVTRPQIRIAFEIRTVGFAGVQKSGLVSRAAASMVSRRWSSLSSKVTYRLTAGKPAAFLLTKSCLNALQHSLWLSCPEGPERKALRSPAHFRKDSP